MVVTLSLPLPSARKPRPKPPLQVRVCPRLTVVIVNYRQWDNTSALVQQLQQSQALRSATADIQIIDNHSPQHPAMLRLQRSRGVNLRRWGRNRGFAQAVNAGVEQSEGDWILLLNPDMSVAEDFLDRVMALAEDLTRCEPQTGIVGLALRNSNGTQQLSAGRFPTLGATLLRLLLPRSQRKYSAVSAQQRSTVDWVTGCGLLVRRTCWEQLRGLDEAFFLYYEDVDLCQRARAAGWHVRHEPTVQATHHHPLHQRGVTPALRVVTRHSLLTYGKKHWSGWQFQLLTRIIRLEAWCRSWLARLRGRQHEMELFKTLGTIAAHLTRDQRQSARRQLEDLTQREAFYQANAKR